MELHEALRLIGALRGEDDPERAQAATTVFEAATKQLPRAVTGLSADEAGDVVLDVMERLLTRGVTNPPEPLKAVAWLRRVLYNQAMDRYRREKRQVRGGLEEEALGAGQATSGSSDPGDTATLEARDALVADVLLVAEDASRRFPKAKPPMLEVARDLVDVYMRQERTFEDLLDREPGKSTSSSRNTLQKRHSRARERLLETWKAEHEAHSDPGAPRCARCNLALSCDTCAYCAPAPSRADGPQPAQPPAAADPRERLYGDPERVAQVRRAITLLRERGTGGRS